MRELKTAGVESNSIFVFFKTYLRGGAFVVAAYNLVAARLLGVQVRDDGVAVTPSGRANRVHRLCRPCWSYLPQPGAQAGPRA